MGLTFDGSQDDTGVVVGDDVGVTIFGLVHLQVGVFPGELLARINGLMRDRGGPDMHRERQGGGGEVRRVDNDTKKTNQGHHENQPNTGSIRHRRGRDG